MEVEEHSVKPLGFHHDCATILDFTVIIQPTIQKKVGTFGQLLDNLKSSASPAFQESNITVLVLDRYDVKHSIKSAEQSRQHLCVGQEVLISSVDRKMPKNISLYLANPNNELNLTKFIFKTRFI